MFILPVVIVVGLTVLQFIFIHMGYQRVQTAAIEGACVAAEGGSLEEIEDVVGLALGYMASGPGAGHVIDDELEGFEVIRQVIDGDDDDEVSIGDTVEISVRIPMKRVSTNYLGLFGGSVDQLHIRSVVKKRIVGPRGICDDDDDADDDDDGGADDDDGGGFDNDVDDDDGTSGDDDDDGTSGVPGDNDEEEPGGD